MGAELRAVRVSSRRVNRQVGLAFVLPCKTTSFPLIGVASASLPPCVLCPALVYQPEELERRWPFLPASSSPLAVPETIFLLSVYTQTCRKPAGLSQWPSPAREPRGSAICPTTAARKSSNRPPGARSASGQMHIKLLAQHSNK